MSDFAPSTGQVAAVLERQARAIAVKLGHTWTGVTPGARPGEYATYCPKCYEWCNLAPRSLNRPPIRGVMVTFECTVKDPPKPAGTCRFCGGAVSYSDKLCTHPLRMGPCAA